MGPQSRLSHLLTLAERDTAHHERFKALLCKDLPDHALRARTVHFGTAHPSAHGTHLERSHSPDSAARHTHGGRRGDLSLCKTVGGLRPIPGHAYRVGYRGPRGCGVDGPRAHPGGSRRRSGRERELTGLARPCRGRTGAAFRWFGLPDGEERDRGLGPNGTGRGPAHPGHRRSPRELTRHPFGVWTPPG